MPFLKGLKADGYGVSIYARARLIDAQDGDKLDVKEATPWLKLQRLAKSLWCFLPRALQKALADSARQAHRLAEAFGQKVPGIPVQPNTSQRKA